MWSNNKNMQLTPNDIAIMPIDEVWFYPTWLESFADETSLNYPDSAAEVVRMVSVLAEKWISTDFELIRLICEKELLTWNKNLSTHTSKEDIEFCKWKIAEFNDLLSQVISGKLIWYIKGPMKISDK